MRYLLNVKTVNEIISSMFSSIQQSAEEAPSEATKMVMETASGVELAISRMSAYYQCTNYLMDQGAMSLVDYSALGFVAGLGITVYGGITLNAPVAGMGMKTMAFSAGIGTGANIALFVAKVNDAAFFN